MIGSTRRMSRPWTAFLAMAIASALAAQETEEKRPTDPGTAELKVEGKAISVMFGRPSTDGPGYKSMEKGVPEGFQWRMGSNDPTKLVTEADLKFGDKVIKAGTYGLWARRAADGWNLVVSSKVIMPNSEGANDTIVAVIALKHAKLEKPVKYMLIELIEDKATKGGTFRLAWGPEEGKAGFTVGK